MPKKETFIREKYAQLAYTISASKEDMLNGENLDRQLWSCVRTSHIGTTLRYALTSASGGCLTKSVVVVVAIHIRLLAIGADANWADAERGNTPLHVAAKENQALQVELLFLYGADVAARNNNSQRPADVARLEKNTQLADRLDHLEFEVCVST